MNTPIPPLLKPITPYVQRGRELMRAKGDEVVAYHCFKHAMEMGIKLNDKSPESQGLLIEIMNDLETMKPHLAGISKDDLKDKCESFAQAVFDRADAIDLAGNADRSTAQTFYAAASFFEILKQFNDNRELDPEIKKMTIYSKWKAAEILKAVKEGRKPSPGGTAGGDASGEDHHESEPSQLPVTPAREKVADFIPVAHMVETPKPSSEPRKPMTPFTRQMSSLSKAQKSDCLEYIKFARAALEADDIQATVERLQAALALLHDK